MELRHVLSVSQFDRRFMNMIFSEACQVRNSLQTLEGRAELEGILRGRRLALLFYEPSTRTRLSFQYAGLHLGMLVGATENAKEFSSAIKGESTADTFSVISRYGVDAIVVRHHEKGGAAEAARNSLVPGINAGDGAGEHPTQALLDLFTIEDKLGSIDGKTIVMGGDLRNGRTVRSLAQALVQFENVKIIFVSPDSLRMGRDVKELLSAHAVRYEETDNIHNVLGGADVVYWTRVQKERMQPEEYENTQRFIIGTEELKMMSRSAILMHPLPRNLEISVDCDTDPRAAYFEQAANGLYVRMALLKWVLGLL
jgi:aspartate carbamoyltransferase catalytic subunit